MHCVIRGGKEVAVDEEGAIRRCGKWLLVIEKVVYCDEKRGVLRHIGTLETLCDGLHEYVLMTVINLARERAHETTIS